MKLIIQRPIGPFQTSIVGDSTMSGGKNTDNLHANMDESTKREAILSQYTELTREQWRLILNSNVFALVISTSAVSQNAPDQEADLMFQFPNDERLAPQNIMSQDHKGEGQKRKFKYLFCFHEFFYQMICFFVNRCITPYCQSQRHIQYPNAAIA